MAINSDFTLYIDSAVASDVQFTNTTLSNITSSTLLISTGSQGFNITNNYFSGSNGSNIFIGDGGSLVTGSGNNGSWNTSLGIDSLYGNTFGYYNTAVGYSSSANITSGNSNTAIGSLALFNNITGSSNTAVGYSTLYTNQATPNTAVGSSALYNNTLGVSNIALGSTALYFNTTGSYNIAIGDSALYGYSSPGAGNYNIGIGYFALSQVQTNMDRNTVIGANALGNLAYSGSSNNVAVGYQAGLVFGTTASLISCSNSTYIGANITASANNVTNEIIIGYNTIGAGSNTVTLGNSSITTTLLRGSVVLGATSTNFKLDVNASGATGSRVYSGSFAVGNINPSNTVGRIDASNDVVAFSTSDIRYKTNIKPIENALSKTLTLNGIEFDWIEDSKIHGNKGNDVGIIAQEIEKILPQVVTTRDTGTKAVKYEKIIPLLIEAIKDLQKQIDELKNKYGN